MPAGVSKCRRANGATCWLKTPGDGSKDSELPVEMPSDWTRTVFAPCRVSLLATQQAIAPWQRRSPTPRARAPAQGCAWGPDREPTSRSRCVSELPGGGKRAHVGACDAVDLAVEEEPRVAIVLDEAEEAQRRTRRPCARGGLRQRAGASDRRHARDGLLLGDHRPNGRWRGGDKGLLRERARRGLVRSVELGELSPTHHNGLCDQQSTWLGPNAPR